MIGQKLYMAVWVRDEDADYEECYHEGASCTCFEKSPNPEGWEEYAVENGIVDEIGAPRDFFWPKTNVPYKSRSSAQYRVNAINRWGGHAVVVECTPKWETVEAANARRADARLQKRIDRKRVELNSLVDQRDLAWLREQLSR